MRSGICPKCGSAAVRYMQSAIFRGRNPKINARGAGFFAAESDDYVCTDCGYFEQYIATPEYLAKIAENWSPVTPEDQPSS